MENSQYTFHTDADQGWLAVPMAELRQLGIGKHISCSSHRQGDVAYLENEDVFVFTRAKGWADDNLQDVPWVDDGVSSPIRYYDRFCLDLPAEEAERVVFENAKWWDSSDQALEYVLLSGIQEFVIVHDVAVSLPRRSWSEFFQSTNSWRKEDEGSD